MNGDTSFLINSNEKLKNIMKNLKTYEGFFDFFKSKPSADDEIALEYIARLKKVKGISPYKITYDPINREGNNFEIDKWIVDFEDTPIKLWSVISLRGNGFDEQSQDLLISKKLARYSDKEFYGLNVICEGEPENCKANPKILKELVELVKSVYENDKEARRIEKIKVNINKAADLIEDENVKESLIEEEPEVQEIRDICLELNDIGFRTKSDEIAKKKNLILIKVTIDDFRKGYRSPFNINDIKETLERIQDFMTDKGYIVGIYIPEKSHNNRMQRVRFFNGNIIRFGDADDGSQIDYPITWCEMLISTSTNWFGKTIKSN